MDLEIIEPDYYYHIYNRGINRQAIFTCHAHYMKFLNLCAKHLTDFVDILSYCLIPNHFHFLVYIHTKPYKGEQKRNASGAFGCLFNAYAQWFNKETNRIGGLFQSPFKRIRIMDQNYLKQVIYYIHRNPMHHGLTENPEKYRYSSYSTIAYNVPSFVQYDHVMQWFDNSSQFAEYHKMKFEIDNAAILEDM